VLVPQYDVITKLRQRAEAAEAEVARLKLVIKDLTAAAGASAAGASK
jgi:hypothetical protein